MFGFRKRISKSDLFPPGISKEAFEEGAMNEWKFFLLFILSFLGTLYHPPNFLSLSSAFKNWMHEDLEQDGVYHEVHRIVLYKKNEGC